MSVRPPRLVELPTLAALRAEVERLRDCAAAGNLRRGGNWSLDQCCQHLGRWVGGSVDGFSGRYPWHYRLFGRIVRVINWHWLITLATRPGLNNPPAMQSMEPDPDLRMGDGVEYLLRQLSRLESGERMCQPSPVEGPLTHEQWQYFHLRHAELHLGFQLPPD